jgi:DNA (cytosine-5)-methyltransferase 1
MLRVIDKCRPAWVLAENVTHIDGMVLEQVEADLESIGYETQTLEVPACAVGQDHWRPRIWVLGYANGDGEPSRPFNAETSRMQRARGKPGSVGEAYGVPTRMDRLRALGNAIVPQVAAIFLEAIKRCSDGQVNDSR